MSQWYIIYNGEKVGPMSKENILAYSPTRDTRVWTEGMEDWQPLYKVPELMELLSGHPNFQPMTPDGNLPPTTPAGTYTTKDKTVCGILALILGGLGVQYFYLGKIGAGLVTILLTIVTCGIWEILTFVQGILMLTMTQEEFNRKFVFTNKFLPLF